MSTRATYLFEATEHTPSVCFYIHYDGYISGAADYFRAMLNHQNDRGGFPAKFLRANALAEFTEGHDRHGDTEYQYTLDGETLTVFHVDTARVAHKGSIYEFVNSYSEGEKFIPVKSGYGAVIWLEASKAVAQVDYLRTSAIDYACQWGECGNSSAAFDGFQKSAEDLAATLGADHPATERLMLQVHTIKDIRAAVAGFVRDQLSNKSGNEIINLALAAGWDGKVTGNSLTYLTALAYRGEFGRAVAK